LVKVKSPYPVDETLDRFEEAVTKKGMTIFTRIDHAQGAASVGKELRPTVVLIFGNPNVGTLLMQSRQTAAIDLPVKLHVGLDHAGCMPAFATVIEGKTSDIEVGRMLNFTKGSIVVFDKGHTDYRWLKHLNAKGVFFVTRLRKNALWRVDGRHPVDRTAGLTSDQAITLTGVKPQELAVPKAFGRVTPDFECVRPVIGRQAGFQLQVL
jgi:hypothetical protein